MAQTTDALNFKDGKVEVSTNGTAWTDISGFHNLVEAGGGDRDVGSKHTSASETPVLTVGKRKPMNIKVAVIYTEGASDPFEVVRAAYEAGSKLWVRWSPKGAHTGDFMFTTDGGYVQNPVYPKGDAASADPIMCEFTLVTPKVTKSTVA